MKLHLEDNIAEGTPEELVEYLRLVEEGEKPKLLLLSFGHAHQPDEDTLKSLIGSLVKVADSYTGSTEEAEEDTASKELKVGDKVKVLESASGAEGEATVTAVREDGYVEIAGTDKHGNFLPNWTSHVTLLLKIEEDEDLEPEEADAPMGYTFWYIDGTVLNNYNVIKSTLRDCFVDSKGRRYPYQSVSGYAKPVDREVVREEFEKARNSGKLLKYYPTVDTFDKE